MECYELDFIIKESLESFPRRYFRFPSVEREASPRLWWKRRLASLWKKGKKKEKQSYNTRGAKLVLRRSPPLPLLKPSTRAPTMRYYLCTFLTFILLRSFRSICVSSRTREKEKEDIETIRRGTVTETVTKKLCSTIWIYPTNRAIYPTVGTQRA